MGRDRNTHTSEFAGRLKELEFFTGSLVSRSRSAPEVCDEGPADGARRTRVPVPRRSRVFLRHGEGHGAFADLTLTAPLHIAAVAD